MGRRVSFELDDRQLAQLQEVAGRAGKTPDEFSASLVEEYLREREFPGIQFRDTAIGRQPYLRGTRMPVWQSIRLLREYEGDVDRTADHLACTPEVVQHAGAYAKAYAEEVEGRIHQGDPTYEEIKAILPEVRELDKPV